MGDSATITCDFTFVTDEKLMIELSDSNIYEGDYSGGSNDRIDIYNVLVYSKTGPFTTIQDVVSLYRQEIVCIRRFNQPECKRQLVNQNFFKIIPMSYTKFHSLLSSAMCYVYLNHIDARYLRAIAHLQTRETLGVIGLGMETEGKIPINYIIVSSSTQTFIFDMFALERLAFPGEIKQLLESKSIQKVIHNSSVFIEYLRKCYKVEVENIFDTAVADLMIQKQRTGVVLEKWRSLSECLSDYFNFPSSLVEDESLHLVWEEQPLSEFCRTRGALLVGYLITLKGKLEGLMLKSFYDGVAVYSNSLL